MYVATSTLRGVQASILGVTLQRQDLRASSSYQLTRRHNTQGTLTIPHRSTWQDFRFSFVAGFEYSGFVYFVTVQREFPALPESSLVTRLVRLCPGDVNFQSYTELTLGCRLPAGSWGTGAGPIATASQLRSKVSSNRSVINLPPPCAALCFHVVHSSLLDVSAISCATPWWIFAELLL